MKNPKWTRRRFITGAATTLGAGGLAGCTVMDRFFGLEKSRFDEEVLVIGGGAAGLSAAYELKKAGIPFRLFEASSRIGGRVYTLENFNADAQWAELGAETFAEDHQIVFELCKELNLPVDEVKWDSGLDPQLMFSRGRISGFKENRSRFQKLSSELIKLKVAMLGDRNEIVTLYNSAEFPMAAKFDLLSISDCLQSMGSSVDAGTLKAFENSCVIQFGRPVTEVSALHLLNSIDLETREARRQYQVRFGNQRLLRTLYERISSVLPDFFVKLDSPLTEIEDLGDYFQCHFKTPDGNRKFQARYVIMALPANQYRRIEGFGDLSIGAQKKLALQKAEMGSHSKVIMSYRQKFWQKKQEAWPASRGVFIKESAPMISRDASGGQAGPRGLLSYLVGGELAETVGAEFPEQVLKEMQVFSRNFKSDYEGLSATLNWRQKNYAEGSYVIYRPAQFLKMHGLWYESDYKGRLTYAGEHCHLTRYGTVAGALESGRRAARQVLEIHKPALKT